jgi:hypothetical protein
MGLLHRCYPGTRKKAGRYLSRRNDKQAGNDASQQYTGGEKKHVPPAFFPDLSESIIFPGAEL